MGSGAYAIVASLAAALVTGVGVTAARLRSDRVRRAAPTIVAFAAGVLVTGSLAHMLPHALSATPRAPLWALAGFVAMVVLSAVASGHVCERDAEDCEPAGWLALLGIGLHSFLDGLTYTVAFAAGHLGGASVALGMILHELPEGLISYALLVRAGHPPRRAALFAWLVAGLTTPLGAIVAVPVLDALAGGLRAVLVAVAGGVLLQVGAAHLLPQAMRKRSPGGVVAFALGVAVAMAAALTHG